MTSHLTEDQISRWFAGQSTPLEQNHVEMCGTCATELDQFRGALDAFRTAVTNRAQWLAQKSSPEAMQILSEHPWTLLESPSLFASLKRAVMDTLFPSKTWTTSAPVDVRDIWSPRQDLRFARRLSLGVHATLVALLILPAVISGPHFATPTLVALYDKIPLILNNPPEVHSGGGGGGGRKALTPPSKGEPPRGADRQLVPPMVEVKNLAPDLVVESTVIAPALDSLILNVQIGDPNGVVGPLSPGPGTGGGIGTGNGTGVGPGTGPGVGPGNGGNTGGGPAGYTIGAGVSAPRLLTQTTPEYSDDARKARIQGAVDLSIIVRADGTVQLLSVLQSLGYGLDQKAIDAVRQWKFVPGKKDGVAVPVRMDVMINFTLR